MNEEIFRKLVNARLEKLEANQLDLYKRTNLLLGVDEQAADAMCSIQSGHESLLETQELLCKTVKDMKETIKAMTN